MSEATSPSVPTLPEQHSLHGLRIHNEQELKNTVFGRPMAGILYDIDGTIRANSITDPGILQSQAEMLRDGMLGAGVSARGESANIVLTEPLRAHLEGIGVDPATVPFFLSTRNGACTELPFARKIIDSHPMSDELYEQIAGHPLVEALQTLTPVSYIEGLKKMYQDFHDKLGVPFSQQLDIRPALLHDVHSIDGKRYKITMYYDPHAVEVARGTGLDRDDAADLIWALTGQEGLPKNAPTMARYLQEALGGDEINITANASATSPEIDVTVAGIDKSTGYKALRGVSSILYNLPQDDIDQRLMTVGDSPDPNYNDAPLLALGIGVTNVGYLTPGGKPYVLDIPGDNIQRVRTLFRTVKRMPSDPALISQRLSKL